MVAPVGAVAASATAPVPTALPFESVTVAPEALSDATWNPAADDDDQDAAIWPDTARLAVSTVAARCDGAGPAATVRLPVAESDDDCEASSVVRAGNSGGSPGRVV